MGTLDGGLHWTRSKTNTLAAPDQAGVFAASNSSMIAPNVPSFVTGGPTAPTSTRATPCAHRSPQRPPAPAASATSPNSTAPRFRSQPTLHPPVASPRTAARHHLRRGRRRLHKALRAQRNRSLFRRLLRHLGACQNLPRRLPQRRRLRHRHQSLGHRRPQRHRHLHRRRPQLAPPQSRTPDSTTRPTPTSIGTPSPSPTPSAPTDASPPSAPPPSLHPRNSPSTGCPIFAHGPIVR